MKLKLGFAAVLAASLSTQSIAETLHDAVQKTIKENPDLQSYKDDRLATEQQIGQVRAAFFPTIDLQGGYGFEQSDNPTTRARLGGKKGTVAYDRAESSIKLRQMLFDGLATPNEVSRTKAATNAKAFLVYSQAEYRALEAVEAYLDVMRAEELLDIASENLEAHENYNEQIKLRIQYGKDRKGDADQSEARIARAKSNKRNAEGNLNDAKTRYMKVVGALPGKLEAPVRPDPKLPKCMDEAVEMAVANHPQLKSANADIEEATYQHKTASAPFMPRVDFESGASYNNNLDGIPGKNEDLTAMVQVRYNILNGGKDLARRKQTAHQIDQAKDIRDNTYRQVVQNMRESCIAYETRQSQVQFNREYWDRAKEVEKAYQLQFSMGQRTLLDLLDTTNEKFVAESNLVNSEYDELFAAYRILAAAAGLNNYLDIALPTEAKPLQEAKK